MANSKTFHGARAQVSINDQLIGIFNQISYGLTYDVQPINILGRFSPDELVYTGQEAVTVNCTGWRVVDAGPHTGAGVPFLKDLLTASDVTLTVFDRQSGKRIAIITNCRPTGYQTTINSRNPTDVSVSFVGLLVNDETSLGQNDEAAGASRLP